MKTVLIGFLLVIGLCSGCVSTNKSNACSKLLLSEEFSDKDCLTKWEKNEGLFVESGVLKAVSNCRVLKTANTYPNNIIVEMDVEKIGNQQYDRWDFRIGIDAIKNEGTLRFDFGNIDGINIGEARDLPGDKVFIQKEGINKGTMRLISTHGFMQLVFTNANGERLISDIIKVPDFDSSRVYFCLAGASDTPRCIDNVKIWQIASESNPFITSNK